MLQNYADSYKNGASDFSGDSNLWPNKFDDSPLTDGAQSLAEYQEEKYF